MNSKNIYDLTDASTSMLATMLFSRHISEESIQALLKEAFDNTLGNDKELSPLLKARLNLPPMPIVICPVSLFVQRKEMLMDSLKEVINVPGPGRATLDGIVQSLNLSSSESTKKREELVTVTASKLFELCFGKYCESMWSEIFDRSAKEGDGYSYGVALMGSDN